MTFKTCQASSRPIFTFDGLVLVQSHEELEEELSGPYCHLENDVIVVEKNSEIVGIGYTIFLPSETKEERCYIFGGVDPDFRRQGIGTSIMNWAVHHLNRLSSLRSNELGAFQI